MSLDYYQHVDYDHEDSISYKRFTEVFADVREMCSLPTKAIMTQFDFLTEC